MTVMTNLFKIKKQHYIKYFHTTSYLRIDPVTTTTILAAGSTGMSVYLTLAIMFIGYTVTTGVIIWNLVSDHQGEVQFALMFPTTGPENVLAIAEDGLRQISDYLDNVESGIRY